MLFRSMTITEYVSTQSYSSGHTVKSIYNSTDKDVLLIGTDEYFFTNNNINISLGRSFTPEDISMNRNVAIIGNDIVVKAFPNVNPIGQKITIKNQNFVVIGVLETKGAVLGQSQDNRIALPITQFLNYFASFWEESLNITIKAYSRDALSATDRKSVV